MQPPVYKVTLLGDGAVGKTALRDQFMIKAFTGEYKKTLGVDIALKTEDVNGKKIKFQIWDLAGQPYYEQVQTPYYKGALGALAIFDVTRHETLNNMWDWVNKQWKNSGRGEIPIILLGNKIDLRESFPNASTSDQGKSLANDLSNVCRDVGFEVSYIETSAKTGTNVRDAFFLLANAITGFIDAHLHSR